MKGGAPGAAGPGTVGSGVGVICVVTTSVRGRLRDSQRRSGCVSPERAVAAALAGGSASARPPSLPGPHASSDREPTPGAPGNGGLDGLAPAHQRDPEEQDLRDFLSGGLDRAAPRERRRGAEVRAGAGDGVRPSPAGRPAFTPGPRPALRSAAHGE